MVIPLEQCSAETQDAVRVALLSPTPPPKWLTLRADGRPMAQIVSRAWWEWKQAHRKNPHGYVRGYVDRQAIIDRDGLVCRLCGDDVPAVADVDIDHIVPVTRGGSDHPSNLQVTHASCNRRKGNRLQEELDIWPAPAC